jgi:hypothetical protein|tara:strand:- start:224 stop:451 length:228 start_codon:yes stop_codon:yes gene_type:complete
MLQGSVDDGLSAYLGLVLTRAPSTLHGRLGGMELGVAHDKLARLHVDALLEGGCAHEELEFATLEVFKSSVEPLE